MLTWAKHVTCAPLTWRKELRLCRGRKSQPRLCPNPHQGEGRNKAREETGQEWGRGVEMDELGGSGRRKGKHRSNVCQVGMNHGHLLATRAQQAGSASLSRAPVICSFQPGMAGPGVLLLLESARGTSPSTEQVAWLVMGSVVLLDLHHFIPCRASCQPHPAPHPSSGNKTPASHHPPQERVEN